MSGNLYAEAFELKDRLGITTSERDGAFDAVLEAASRWIDRVTGHRFYAASETRYYTLMNASRNGGVSIIVDDVLAVTAVQTDNNGDGVYETTWTVTTDYWLGPRNAPAKNLPYTEIHRTYTTGRFYFPAYDEAILVTGSFGYSTLLNRPAPIHELCLMAGMVMARPVLDMSIPGIRQYTIGQDLSITMSPEDLPPMGQKILNAYREPVFAL